MPPTANKELKHHGSISSGLLLHKFAVQGMNAVLLRQEAECVRRRGRSRSGFKQDFRKAMLRFQSEK
eukprot:246502-Pelagomonas_calceolata.AAC.2